jgi:ribosomal protein S18 acetylase RimI-like enzyme
MENFRDFSPLLKQMLKEIYGSEEKGLKIYTERYNAINYYRNYSAKPNSILLVAETPDGKPVGFLYARKFKDHIYLYDISVDKNFRGKGIGTALVKYLLENFGRPIVTDTHRGAKSFFERLGFKVRKSYTEDGVEWFTMKLPVEKKD